MTIIKLKDVLSFLLKRFCFTQLGQNFVFQHFGKQRVFVSKKWPLERTNEISRQSLLFTVMPLIVLCIFLSSCHSKNNQHEPPRYWAAMAFAIATLPEDANLPLPFYILCEPTAAGIMVHIRGFFDDYERVIATNGMVQVISLDGTIALMKGASWRGRFDAEKRIASPKQIKAISSAFLWNEMYGVQERECHVDVLDEHKRGTTVLLEYDQSILDQHVIYSLGAHGSFRTP